MSNIIPHPTRPVQIFSVNALADHVGVHADHLRHVIAKAQKAGQPLVWKEWHFRRITHDWLAVHESDLHRVQFIKREAL